MCNKKFYGVLLIIVLLVSKVFAVESYNTTIANSKLELAKIIFKGEIEKEVEEKTYFEFIKKTIPAKFVKPFYDFTYKNKQLGIELLGTAKHESGWVKFEGPINSNGTRDYGPLMLNSANLDNEELNQEASIDTDEVELPEEEIGTFKQGVCPFCNSQLAKNGIDGNYINIICEDCGAEYKINADNEKVYLK